MDDRAAKLIAAGKDAEAVELVTAFGVTTGEKMTVDWREFWMFLFARVRDGFTVTPPTLPTCKRGERKGCTARPVPQAAQSGYSDAWYARIVANPENAAHYAVPPEAMANEASRAANLRKVLRMDKRHE